MARQRELPEPIKLRTWEDALPAHVHPTPIPPAVPGNDFTEWLALEENLSLLADELGFDLKLVQVEAEVGGSGRECCGDLVRSAGYPRRGGPIIER